MPISKPGLGSTGWKPQVDAAIDRVNALDGIETSIAAKQDADSDLTAIAAIDAAQPGVLASDGSGWLRKSYAALKAALGLVKADVGLANVDNTSDVAKPVSTAGQAALDAKASSAHNHDNTYVDFVNAQSIGGVKTFTTSGSPVIPAPVGAGNPVRNDDARLAAVATRAPLPEATTTPRTAALGTPSGLLGYTNRYALTGAVTEALPAVADGAVLAFAVTAGSTASLTLNRNGTDYFGDGTSTSLVLAPGDYYFARGQVVSGQGRWRRLSGPVLAEQQVSPAQQLAFAAHRAQRKLRIPAGVKMRGANIVPKPNGPKFGGGTGPQGWPEMWAEWDWAGWIKPQIDAAVSAGCNTVRLIGGVGAQLRFSREGTTARAISTVVYLARCKQYFDYCEQLGVLVYATGGDLGQLPSGYSQAEVISALQPWALLCETCPNIVGLDLLQESYYTVGNGNPPAGITTLPDLHTYLSQVATGVRSYTTLPITFSQPTNAAASNSGVFSDTTNMTAASAYCDFLDFHVYYAPAINDTAPAMALGKEVVIGEAGLSMSNATATRVAQIQAMAALSGHLGLAGSIYWAITDQDTVAGNQWGLYDAAFTGRTAEIAAFRAWSTDSRQWTVELPLAADFSFAAGDQSGGVAIASLTLTLPEPWYVDVDLAAFMAVSTSFQTAVLSVFGTTPSGVGAAASSGRSDGTTSWSTSSTGFARNALQPAGSGNYTLRAVRAANATGGGNIYASGRTKAVYRFRKP